MYLDIGKFSIFRVPILDGVLNLSKFLKFSTPEFADDGCQSTKHKFKTSVMTQKRVVAEFQSLVVSRCRPAGGRD